MASSCLVVASAFVIGLLVIPSVQAQPPSLSLSLSLSLSEESTYAGEHTDEEGSVALGEQAAWCEMNSDSEECQMRVDLLQRNVEKRMISSKQGASAEAKIVEHAEDESVSNSTSTSYYLIENDNGGKCLKAQATDDMDYTVAKYTDFQTCDASNDLQKWTISSSNSICQFCLYDYPDICVARVGLGKYGYVVGTRRRETPVGYAYQLSGGWRRRNARRREMIKLWTTPSSSSSTCVYGVDVSSDHLYNAGSSSCDDGGANFRFWKNGQSDDMLGVTELSDIGCYNEAAEDY